MDWFSTHRALVDSFTKKVLFRKLGHLELKVQGDSKVWPTCVISTLKAKRLPHKGCKAYLAYVVDKSSSRVTLDSASIVREFLDVCRRLILSGLLCLFFIIWASNLVIFFLFIHRVFESFSISYLFCICFVSNCLFVVKCHVVFVSYHVVFSYLFRSNVVLFIFVL